MAENKRSQQMKEITQKLEKGVKEIFTSEMYKGVSENNVAVP